MTTTTGAFRVITTNLLIAWRGAEHPATMKVPITYPPHATLVCDQCGVAWATPRRGPGFNPHCWICGTRKQVRVWSTDPQSPDERGHIDPRGRGLPPEGLTAGPLDPPTPR